MILLTIIYIEAIPGSWLFFSPSYLSWEASSDMVLNDALLVSMPLWNPLSWVLAEPSDLLPTDRIWQRWRDVTSMIIL